MLKTACLYHKMQDFTIFDSTWTNSNFS